MQRMSKVWLKVSLYNMRYQALPRSRPHTVRHTHAPALTPALAPIPDQRNFLRWRHATGPCSDNLLHLTLEQLRSDPDAVRLALDIFAVVGSNGYVRLVKKLYKRLAPATAPAWPAVLRRLVGRAIIRIDMTPDARLTHFAWESRGLQLIFYRAMPDQVRARNSRCECC